MRSELEIQHVNRHFRIIAACLILLHLAVSFVHGLAHNKAAVTLTNFGSAYVLIVITLAPLVAGLLLWTHWRKFGGLLLAASMLGSFVFGAWYHFLATGNDNIAQVHGAWHSTFAWTAVALAALELTGAIVGVLVAVPAKAQIKV